MASIRERLATGQHSSAGTQRFLPMTRAEMADRGWNELDILLVSGDAYVDHPAFGVAVVARCLEAAGYRIGIVAQPRWDRIDDLVQLGPPRLFVGVSAGNLDSMLNKLTAQKKTRSLDAYSPDGVPGQRPNRATIVYSQLCRQAFPGVPVIIGGIEASLRRIAHYDYWSDSVRRSIVLDAKADLLLFGMAESTVVAVADHLRAGADIRALSDLRATAFALGRRELWESKLAEGTHESAATCLPLVLPSYEAVCSDPTAFGRLTRLVELESNPFNARPLLQPHGNEAVYLNPPNWPLSTEQLDAIHALPFQRLPHPRYQGRRIPAFDTVRDSVVALRGCYGGCTFCSIAVHEGRIIQARSASSVVAEVTQLAQRKAFSGTITDVGGPTANMYATGCSRPDLQQRCRRSSCLYPSQCRYLDANHDAYIGLLQAVRRVQGVKHVFVASGIRYDLANSSPNFVKQLAANHVGGQLSVAPEHVCHDPLDAMRKPPITTYERFVALFERESRAANRNQYLVPYFVVGHPGTTMTDSIELALYLKQRGIRPRQVQEFIPTPMTVATSMYYTGLDPATNQPVSIVRNPRERRLQKALALYYDPQQAPYVREALALGRRQDLIGRGPGCLVSPESPGPKRRLRHR